MCVCVCSAHAGVYLHATCQNVAKRYMQVKPRLRWCRCSLSVHWLALHGGENAPAQWQQALQRDAEDQAETQHIGSADSAEEAYMQVHGARAGHDTWARTRTDAQNEPQARHRTTPDTERSRTPENRTNSECTLDQQKCTNAPPERHKFAATQQEPVTTCEGRNTEGCVT